MHSQPRVLQASLTAATALLSVVWAASGLADPAGTVLPSINSRTDRFALSRPPDVPSDAELELAGARIGEMRVETQNIFDTSIPEEDTALFRLGNRLHIETR